MSFWDQAGTGKIKTNNSSVMTLRFPCRNATPRCCLGCLGQQISHTSCTLFPKSRSLVGQGEGVWQADEWLSSAAQVEPVSPLSFPPALRQQMEDEHPAGLGDWPLTAWAVSGAWHRNWKYSVAFTHWRGFRVPRDCSAYCAKLQFVLIPLHLWLQLILVSPIRCHCLM